MIPIIPMPGCLAEPGEILHAGDRVYIGLRPGAAAGMHKAFVRRDLWATIWDTEGAKALPTFEMESLLELSPLMRQFNEREG
ncbi:hypothetical protein DBP19_19395 [Streptomyces sp. CS090A]|nr:hypothetical protein DBP19_19395 [Streptomyces sp. CS090A]